jgi:hypothetical protein
MAELNDFQRKILLGQGAGVTLYTQKEFDAALTEAKAEIMAIAIQTTRQAILIEREECAKIVDAWINSLSSEPEMVEIAEAIRNRIPSQRQ